MKKKGLFEYGETVTLWDRRERQYMFTLAIGKRFESHIGNVEHEDLVGQSEGSWVTTNKGHFLLAFRPTKAEYTVNMKRIATVVYPKDIGIILSYANVYPGAKVLEAGSGSGALTIALSDAVGSTGSVISYDVREDMSKLAQSNLEIVAEFPQNVSFKVGNLQEEDLESDFDSAVLDMPEPWHCIENVSNSLKLGGVLLTFLPTIMQVSDLVESLRKSGEYALIATREIMERPWQIEGRSVRPMHRMVGHTGFITTARRYLPKPFHGK